MADAFLKKKVLRKEVKSILSRLSSEEKARQSESVCLKLMSSVEYQNAQSISIYLNMPDEIQTLRILKHALG